MKIKLNFFMFFIALNLFSIGCQKGSDDTSNSITQEAPATSAPEKPDDPGTPKSQEQQDSEDITDHIQNDPNIAEEIKSLGCLKASSSQKSQVQLGLSKKDRFLQRCAEETNNSFWCDQVVHPNLRSSSTFRCTYGSSQVHNLVHPDERTWKYPIEAIKILQELTGKGLKVSRIYNWWRPEPYNKNVGGAAGRHPYGTSIDVRFASDSEANRAFRELCKMRRNKRIRAIGHYGSSSLHIGVGDRIANTWGKSCN